ncbi:hypothetical protein MRX96_038569 [Rhipicephalus microplus]
MEWLSTPVHFVFRSTAGFAQFAPERGPEIEAQKSVQPCVQTRSSLVRGGGCCLQKCIVSAVVCATLTGTVCTSLRAHRVVPAGSEARDQHDAVYFRVSSGL